MSFHHSRNADKLVHNDFKKIKITKPNKNKYDLANHLPSIKKLF